MRYNRKEAFRYEFGQPLRCSIKVIDKEKVHSQDGIRGLIHDISPRGLKFSCPVDFPTNKENLQIEVYFILNVEPIFIQGKIKWKRILGTTYTYGLEVLEDDIESREFLINELKVYSKNALSKK